MSGLFTAQVIYVQGSNTVSKVWKRCGALDYRDTEKKLETLTFSCVWIYIAHMHAWERTQTHTHTYTHTRTRTHTHTHRAWWWRQSIFQVVGRLVAWLELCYHLRQKCEVFSTYTLSPGLFCVSSATIKRCFSLCLTSRAVVWSGQCTGLAVWSTTQRVDRSPERADESGHGARWSGGSGHGHATPVCSHTVSNTL